MKIKIKKSYYDIEKNTNLLDFILKINNKKNESLFCKKGQCKNCYVMILNTSTYETKEILACQTRVYGEMKVIALSKNLSL